MILYIVSNSNIILMHDVYLGTSYHLPGPFSSIEKRLWKYRGGRVGDQNRLGVILGRLGTISGSVVTLIRATFEPDRARFS